jgi:hypothetical protein
LIEALAIPLLSKAIDFLFEEGKKILEERRKRKESEQKNPASNLSDTNKPISRPIMVTISSKEEAMNQSISESSWLNSEERIKHLMSLIEIHSRNYYHAKEQYAQWGSALVPAIIVNNLKESEDAVGDTIKELEIALTNLYGKKVKIGDELLE